MTKREGGKARGQKELVQRSQRNCDQFQRGLVLVRLLERLMDVYENVIIEMNGA